MHYFERLTLRLWVPQAQLLQLGTSIQLDRPENPAGKPSRACSILPKSRGSHNRWTFAAPEIFHSRSIACDGLLLTAKRSRCAAIKGATRPGMLGQALQVDPCWRTIPSNCSADVTKKHCQIHIAEVGQSAKQCIGNACALSAGCRRGWQRGMAAAHLPMRIQTDAPELLAAQS